MTFGEKLQGLRARAGLSQDALAELLDVSRQAVSKWERNEAMPEAEKVVRISRQFGVSTDYLLLEELEEPETPKAPIPAAGPWDRVKRWYRNKGYLLAWALVAWGVWNLADIANLAVGFYLESQDHGINWEKALRVIYAPVVIPHVLLILAAVFLVCRGRRLAGRLRWYHLGWLPVLAGLLGIRAPLTAPLRFLQTGPVWSISTALLVYLAEYGPEDMWEFLKMAFWDDLLCLLVSGLGLAILILGCRRERKRASTKSE